MFSLARCVLLLGLLISLAAAHSVKRSSLDYVTLLEQAEIHTPSNRVHANSEFDLTFTLHAHQQEIRLTLEPNHDLLPEAAKIEFLDSDGNVARTEPIVRADHKAFKGYAWTRSKSGWERAGWARIVVRQDGPKPLFEGAFVLDNDNHHILTKTNYLQTRHHLDPHLKNTGDDVMVVFRDSDYADARLELKRDVEEGCAADGLDFNVDPHHPVFSTPIKREASLWGSISTNNLFGKRQIDGGTGGVPGNSAGVNLRSSIGSTAGCPTTRRIALVGVATDCTYTADFSSANDTRQNVISQLNTASAVYEKTFNITLGLHTLTMSDANCPSSPPAAAPWNVPCSANDTITDRLNQFSAWRGQRSGDGNAFWTLLSTCNTGSAVGLSWLGMLCVDQAQNSSSQTVAGANVVVRTNTEWQVIAHEVGHTFGAVHDCLSSTCADSSTVNAQQCCPLSQSTCATSGQYIMAPATSRGISDFSPCSVGNICSALSHSVKTTCLQENKNVQLLSGPQCGNGIVEEGEACDCGGAEGCANNSCCGTDCQLKAGAQCDASNQECCDSTCKFASASTVCRASSGVCDPEEKCSGTSASCPANKQAPNGQSCGANGLTCASGQCTSRDLQCKSLMGSLTSDNSTTSCDSSDCTVSCSSPQFGPGTCYGLNQFLLDGTPCSGGGMCSNGLCEGSSAIKEAGDWISKNKPLVIGLASVVGAIIIFGIISCIWRSCGPSARRRRRRRQLRRHKNQPSFSSTAGVHGGQHGRWPAPAYTSERSDVPEVPQAYYNWHGGQQGGAAVRYA